MYSSRSGLILGFHGCDESILEEVVYKTQQLKDSKNSYDWLGHGSYFWENSDSRAMEFAQTLSSKTSGKIKKPAVLGAVLDLGFCLDLLDYRNLTHLKDSYELLQGAYELSGFKLPENKAPKGEENDLLLRDLDCAVIEALHKTREARGLKPYDSVKGVFWEGKMLYPNAGFREKDHIQICIRNPNCIKGYFIPRTINDDFESV
jgi:hypothetical protein